jgi:hypothetical protein
MRSARALFPFTSFALFLAAAVAGMPHSALSATDVFSSWGGKWHVSFNGTEPWQDLNTSNIGVSDLRFGDFDGNCTTDVLSSWGGKWHVSFDGTGPWQNLNTSNIGVSDLGLGNFDGNNVTADTMARVCLWPSRFSTSALTIAQATAIVASMSTVIQTNDGVGDVACLAQYTLAGAIPAFATGDGSIDSQAEFNAVIALPGHVKVVNQINWCGALIPNVIGCSPTPGESEVVTRFTAAQEGILWLHEYGHTRGLGHRMAITAVMNPTIGINRRMVNASECTAFRR